MFEQNSNHKLCHHKTFPQGKAGAKDLKIPRIFETIQMDHSVINFGKSRYFACQFWTFCIELHICFGERNPTKVNQVRLDPNQRNIPFSKCFYIFLEKNSNDGISASQMRYLELSLLHRRYCLHREQLVIYFMYHYFVSLGRFSYFCQKNNTL